LTFFQTDFGTQPRRFGKSVDTAYQMNHLKIKQKTFELILLSILSFYLIKRTLLGCLSLLKLAFARFQIVRSALESIKSRTFFACDNFDFQNVNSEHKKLLRKNARERKIRREKKRTWNRRAWKKAAALSISQLAWNQKWSNASPARPETMIASDY